MSLSLNAFAGKTVLITGATGFTGRVVTEKLVEHGANVRVIARSSSNPGDLEKHHIQWFRGDVFDPEIVKQACDGVHYIFNLAAAFREEKENDDAYRQVHLTATQLLACEVENQADFECFVHVSTVGVHGHIEVDRADEEYRFSPGDGYQRTKLEGEQWLAGYAAEKNIPFSIIRPAPIFGPGDLRLLKLFRMINKGYLLILGKGKCIYHLVHVDDLSNMILLAGITPAARSEVMIGAGDDPIPLVDMANIIAEKIGLKKLSVMRLPLLPFYLASDICKIICTPLGIQPPIYRRRVDFYTKDRKFTNAKVKRLLDYTCNYNNEQGIEETANWYQSQKLLG